MPFFNGVNAAGEPSRGPLSWAEIPTFIADCKANGWRRLAISENRLLATFNEDGEWFHPDVMESA
jgi:hypothetical protein